MLSVVMMSVILLNVVAPIGVVIKNYLLIVPSLVRGKTILGLYYKTFYSANQYSGVIS
jgi:hypothetical protein